MRFGQPVPSCVPTETAGSPKFLGNPHCTFAGLFDPGRTTGVRPLRRRGSAPGAATSRAPALPLSRLNPPALVLAVYASPRRSPAKDARLASGCWSGSAGRARSAGFHREVSECSTSHPPLPSLLGAMPHSGHGKKRGGVHYCSARWVLVSCRCAQSRPQGTRRGGVPLPQPRERPPRVVRRPSRLRGLRAGIGAGSRARADACVELLPHAQSLAPAPVAQGGPPPGRVHAPATGHARAAVAPAPPQHRPRAPLPRRVQELSRAGRRPFHDRRPATSSATPCGRTW